MNILSLDLGVIEMAKELLWRKYPTDQKGSYFRMFWNKGDSEITSDQDYYDTDVHAGVDDSLHLNQLPEAWNSSDRLVLVMRGELFDKFPGVQVYATKGVIGNHDGNEVTPDQLTHSSNETDILMPEFKAKLGHDLYLVSFNLTVAQALGSGQEDDLGYYFVFQERMGELRFGLDESGNEQVNFWSDMHWGFSILQNFINVNSDHFDTEGTFNQMNNQGDWGESSSRMAQITNQQPTLFKVHASNLIQQV